MNAEMILSNEPVPTNWYAVYTKPRAEKKVFERLCAQGFEAYLPLQTRMREWSDRKKKIQTPLISSYVFINTKKEDLFTALQIQGTSRILKYLGKPAIIREYEIENLKILLNAPEQVSNLEGVSFEKGVPVKVIKGAFTGLIAECVCIQGKHRIIVEVEAMGSKLEVNIPLSFIEKYAH